MAWKDDEDEDDLDEREDPGVEDADWNMDPALVPCPYCKREVSEDAERCPYCGSYILKEHAAAAKLWWWMVAVVLLVLLLIAYVLRRW